MRALTVLAVAVVATVSFIMPAAAAEPEARLVRDIKIAGGSDPHYPTRAKGLVFFSANDGIHGKELWVTDGTGAGTRLVRDINRGGEGSVPRQLTKVGSRLFFSAIDATHGRELWVSDGTAAGTKLVKDLTAGKEGSSVSSIADAGGTAYVVRNARELWRSDGTAAGTSRLRSFDGVTVDDSVALGKVLLFSADGLWKTKGTVASTQRLTPAGGHADLLTRFNGQVYFRRVGAAGAPGAEPSPELWRSDGTKAGTGRFGQVYDPRDLSVLGGHLYLDGRASGFDRLFRSDGTVAGTGPVVPKVGPMFGLLVAAGRLWSTAVGQMDEPHSLWVSDGTATGTSRLYGGGNDWYVSDWRRIDGVGMAGRLWFAAGPLDTGPGDSDELPFLDQEPWASDGTTEGTLEVADINPDGSSLPRDFVKLGQRILFSADDGEHGRELWSMRTTG